MNPLLRLLALALLPLALAPAANAATLGPDGLRAAHAQLAPQIARSPLGAPVHLQSQERDRVLQGEVFAVLDHPYATVAGVLAEPSAWCEILILHLNTKYCRRFGEPTQIEMRVGTKREQLINSASLVLFKWKPPQVRPDYLRIDMEAPEGPYGTRDYRLQAEVVPLDRGRSLLHMGYSFSYGRGSQLAMEFYLATLGRDKVGFTVDGDGLVGGMRGAVERNTVRYFLAVDAYLHSLAAPPEQQLEKRLAAWFEATEKFPRQLHELDRDEYLRMKRNEVRRQRETK